MLDGHRLFLSDSRADELVFLTVKMGMSSRGRSDVQRTALFMSDGHSNINQQNTIPAAIALRHTGSIILVFAIGTDVGWDELNGIASQPVNRTIFAVGSYTQLPNIVSQVRTATSDGMYCPIRREATIFGLGAVVKIVRATFHGGPLKSS